MIHTSSKQVQDRAVALWLLICCTLVFAMVILGGVTRLTGSGLSMVDWRPFLGWLPPFGDAEWQHVFELYQQSPEFQRVNMQMGVGAFKQIFWLEYLHRLLGRVIGIVFLLPFVFFVAKRYIHAAEWLKYLVMFLLGGLQGVLGWYMVKSGLVDVPHVSQYRLTAHLVAAFLIYAYMFWVALSLLYPAGKSPRHPWFIRSLGVTVLTALTIVSGGFVAGLKAGKIFNTFPMMGDFWIPPGAMTLQPIWRNFFENAATVQFDHRVLAITTFLTVVVFWIGARNADLPQRARKAVNALLHTATLQLVLGITTLLMAVPIVLGALHQAVAMLLFTVSLFVLHSVRRA
jgi:cytochrome c oxidase assembly protein subunit 15